MRPILKHLITRLSLGQQLRKCVNFVEFTSIYLNLLEFAVFENRVTDGPRTDKASYKVAFRN